MTMGEKASRRWPSASRIASLRRAGRKAGPLGPADWALVVAGVLLVAGVVAWQVNATLWTTHSRRVGQALVHRFLDDRTQPSPATTAAPSPSSVATAPSSATLASCSASNGDPVQGLLEMPELGVVAPVEQGVGDAQLDVAVGHNPASVWPGQNGNAVLAAHDVSYFTGLPQLVSGDTIRYVTPCTTYVFEVSAHSVVRSGSPVYDTPTPTLTLVTCWPTDALWFTPDRYLVTADEVSEVPTVAGAQYMTASPPPSVPVPAALASQGVTLATYSLPMGTMVLAGSPDPAWAQTTDPLLVQDSAVEAFIAGVRSLAEDHPDWWRAVAPHVAVPRPLVGADNPGYLTPLDVVVSAEGTQATSVTLTDEVSVTGGGAPGRYTMTVVEAIHDGTLVVTAWTTEPTDGASEVPVRADRLLG